MIQIHHPLSPIFLGGIFHLLQKHIFSFFLPLKSHTSAVLFNRIQMTYLSRGNMIINMKLPDIPVVRCLRQIGWSWYICLQKNPLNIYILIYVLRFVSVCVGLTFFSVTVITFGSLFPLHCKFLATTDTRTRTRTALTSCHHTSVPRSRWVDLWSSTP